MRLTDQQQSAVGHRGSSLLLAASAGSGKTEVLSRRCVSLIADPAEPCGVDELLVVTFTRAAAAELRARIAGMLRDAAESADAGMRQHLARQQVLLETAEIGTIDAWCARLLREFYSDSEIDPAFRVLDAEQAALLRRSVLDELMEWACSSDDPLAAAARDLLARAGQPHDPFLREMILGLHAFRERLLDPATWFAQHEALLNSDGDAIRTHARRILAQAIGNECGFQHEQLAQTLPTIQEPRIRALLETYAAALETWKAALASPAALETTAAGIAAFRLRKPNKLPGGADADFFEDLREKWHKRRLIKAYDLESIDELIAAAEPCAAVGRTLLGLEARFNHLLGQAKANLSALEFGDILRAALNLLGRPDGRGSLVPSDVAVRLRQRYRYVLVDEFQDTSPLQVELLRLVTRAAPEKTNAFWVGDIKQSIYGFREAEPRLFQQLIARLQTGRDDGRVQNLVDNFRSHATLVEAVNRLFARLFDPQLGGTGYDKSEHLTARRGELPNPGLDAAPRLHIDVVAKPPKNADAGDEDDDDDNGIPPESAEREAMLAAVRIRELLAAGVQVLDRADGRPILRPLRYADIVVLVRTARRKAGQIAAELRRADIPCIAGGRESVLDSIEVGDVRSVLSLLCSRRHDVALAAYLRSPLVGLQPAELLAIRRARADGALIDAAESFLQSDQVSDTARRLRAALDQLDTWAAVARRASISALVRRILADSGLILFARALRGGQHRVAMLRAFTRLAANFERTGGLAEFVQHLDALEEEEVVPEIAATSGEDVVRVMTIHASKGLEFPVVFLLDAGATFSAGRRMGALRCDESLGLGFSFFDARRRKHLTSPADPILRARRNHRELEEELRLLYVAATRARELLFVIGHADSDKLQSRIDRHTGRPVPLIDRINASSTLEWLLLATAAGRADQPAGAQPALVAIEQHTAEAVEKRPTAGTQPLPTAAARQPVVRGDWLNRAAQLLTAPLDRSLASRPAVLSVSALKQLTADAADAPRSLDPPVTRLEPPRFAGPAEPDGRALGTAVHRFLEFADLADLRDEPAIRRQIESLVAQRRLNADDAAILPVAQLAWLGRSDAGALLAAHAASARREVPFAFSLPSSAAPDAPTLIRGVIDCLLDSPAGLVLIDYKTDHVRDEAQLSERLERYSLQIALYARAAGQIFQRPVADCLLALLAHERIVRVDNAAERIDRHLASL